DHKLDAYSLEVAGRLMQASWPLKGCTMLHGMLQSSCCLKGYSLDAAKQLPPIMLHGYPLPTAACG
ncbi:hypothetical protein Dimus_030865, partial [Dionaea muscipula]